MTPREGSAEAAAGMMRNTVITSMAATKLPVERTKDQNPNLRRMTFSLVLTLVLLF
jgi:hypothetical protein